MKVALAGEARVVGSDGLGENVVTTSFQSNVGSVVIGTSLSIHDSDAISTSDVFGTLLT